MDDEKILISEIDKKKLPQHIAIIMDGNGRWAKQKHKPRIYGHRAGIKSVRQVVEGCVEIKIKILTLYAFSTENWLRPELEIYALMNLLKQYLKKELEELQERNIKFITIGDISKLPKYVLKELEYVKEKTKNNTALTLNLALNYGARQEIIHTVNKIISETNYKDINENFFKKYLYTSDLPDPDLLIRTSGEHRISNFLLWQIAYTELYFTPVLWPDFTKIDLFKAILEFQKRERRFGKV